MNQVSRNIGRESRPQYVPSSWLLSIVPLKQAARSMLKTGGPKLIRPFFAALLACSLAGCQSFSIPFAQWTSAYDSGLAKKITNDEKQAPASDKLEEPRTLIQRWLNSKSDDTNDDNTPKLPTSNSPSTLILGSDGWRPMLKPQKNPEAEKEFDEAHKLFMQGKLNEAETAFTKIAKNRKGTHYGEKSQFYVAEIQYQQKKYVRANDSYEKLFADYPGTELLDKLVSREYSLAQMWLRKVTPRRSPTRSSPGRLTSPASCRSSTPREPGSEHSSTCGITGRMVLLPTTRYFRLPSFI